MVSSRKNDHIGYFVHGKSEKEKKVGMVAWAGRVFLEPREFSLFLAMFFYPEKEFGLLTNYRILF